MSTRNLADEELTQAVVASFGDCTSERFQEIAQSLVRHLHAFASEVKLTEDEWFAGIQFLTATGDITDDKRQEFILLSDVLGLSMLVVGLNHRKPATATPSTVLGPFFVEGSPRFENGDDIANRAPGDPCLVQGRVVSVTGEAVAGARLEIWQADDDGFYDVQQPDLQEPRGRGHLYSAPDGRYWFWTMKPTFYPIPADGPVGNLLASANRSPMRPAHVHFMVSSPGYETVTTHVFADGDPYLDSDAVFGVKSELIAPVVRHEPGRADDGRELDVPFWSIGHDIVLAPAASDGAAKQHGRTAATR
jgi:hydroxyquinol 1,2-dioxygenase